MVYHENRIQSEVRCGLTYPKLNNFHLYVAPVADDEAVRTGRDVIS